MGTWMPQIDPALLKAALGARQPIPPAPQIPRQVLPRANAMPLPVPVPPPTDLPMPGQPMASQPLIPMAPAVVPRRTTSVPMRPVEPLALTATPPPPSDNPAVAEQPENPWAKAVADARTGVDEERQRADTLMGQQPQRPNYEDYKAPLWKRIAAATGGVLASRWAGPQAGNAIAALPYGKWNRAQEGYEQANKAWNEKMQAEERVGVPLAADRARIAQEGFTNWMATQKQTEVERHNREVESFKSDLNDIRRMYDEGRLDAAQKRLDETAEKNKNNAEIQGQILEVRKQLADASSLRAKADMERADKYKSGETPGEGGMSRVQQGEYNTRTKSIQRDIDRIERDRSEAMKTIHMYEAGGIAIKPEFKKRVDDYDAQIKAKHDEMDKIEQEIMGRGGKGKTGAGAGVGATVTETTKTFTVPKGAPPPQKPHQQLKSGGKVIAYSADGKTWGPPQ